MKRTIKTQILAAALALLLMSAALPALAAVPEDGAVSPLNIAITRNTSTFTESGDTLSCYAHTRVDTGYTAYVKAELQRQNGSSWTTVKSWSDKGGQTATVDETYEPTDKGTYRLYVTHKAYNSSGTCVETITNIKY